MGQWAHPGLPPAPAVGEGRDVCVRVYVSGVCVCVYVYVMLRWEGFCAVVFSHGSRLIAGRGAQGFPP